jgi:hypothetical protein
MIYGLCSDEGRSQMAGSHHNQWEMNAIVKCFLAGNEWSGEVFFAGII